VLPLSQLLAIECSGNHVTLFYKPNRVPQHLLSRLAKATGNLWSVEEVSRPYVWAQKLAFITEVWPRTDAWTDIWMKR
jgi:hypothetical protein